MNLREDRALATFHRVRAAALRAVEEGRILHFDAPAAPATRRRDAMPPLRGTVGRVVNALGREAWAVYTYGPRGTSDEFDTPREAVRDLCMRLGPYRIGALQDGIRKAFADELDAEDEERERRLDLWVTETRRAAAGRDVLRRMRLV